MVFNEGMWYVSNVYINYHCIIHIQCHLLLSTTTDDEFIGVRVLAQGISAKMDATTDSSVNLHMSDDLV